MDRRDMHRFHVVVICSGLLACSEDPVASSSDTADSATVDTTVATDSVSATDAQATDTSRVTDVPADSEVVLDTGMADVPADVVLHGPGTDGLMAQMQADDGVNYTRAVNAGVTFVPSSDGESFYAWWKPAGFDAAKDGVIVSLPGHDVFASTSFVVWQPFLNERHYAFIGIQWWFGQGETAYDYYTPDAAYRLMEEALDAQGIADGRALFEGFSRGSANTYAVTVLDRQRATARFLMTVANSGSMESTYPPNKPIEDGTYGAKPFEGSHWVLYCGEKDENISSGCSAMHNTETWLLGKGATIDLFIQDPTGGHGGFHQNHANANAALDIYDTLGGR